MPASDTSPTHLRRSRLNLRRVALLVSILVILAAAALVWTQFSAPVEIPTGTPSGEIAFISDAFDTWDVYLLKPDGTQTNLTAHGEADSDNAGDFFASWDFAAERINILTDRTGEIGPAQINPQSGTVRTLSITDAITTLFFEGRLDWDPSWSPASSDGGGASGVPGVQVVWSSLRDFNLELYTASTENPDAVTRLTNDPARDWFASWSPDGTRIAFTSDRSGNEDIYLINADGSDLRQVTDHPADDIHPAWSLDGQSLLFVSERDTPLSGEMMPLYIIPIQAVESGNAESQVRRFPADESFEGDLVCSANGRTCVFMRYQDGIWSLYQRDGDNIERRLTGPDSNALFPVWKP